VISPEQAVDAIAERYGVHATTRALHAKGILCRGRFTATPEAARLTRAAHMQGEPVDCTVRFSNGAGDPGQPDYAPDVRGMATKFYLPDGSKTDIVSLSLPCFFARTPEDFLEFTRLRKPDPETGQPDFEKLGEWMGKHPEAGPAIRAALTTDPPESYATVAYNSIHAFRWTAPDGTERRVRYRFEPEEGERTLSEEAARELGGDYLQDEIVGRGSSAFTLVVIVANDGDEVDDPTVPWPSDRERVEVGRLELTGPDIERERGDDILVFDPARVTDGIELSDDPILRFRPRAYAVSVTRRSGAPAPVGA
jgi:catalase